MASRKLRKDAQIYIVQQLAMYEKPARVRETLKEELGVDITIQAVMNYQITNPQFPEKWRGLFESTRARFLDTISDIPIANKAVRLRELQKLYDRETHSKKQNPVAMRETLEQAAKESGDAYTNRRELTGANGGAIQTEVILPTLPDVHES